MKYFVWVTGVAGPEAQIWTDIQTNGEGKPKPFLACHAIADNDKRSIEELRRDFRYEAKS